MNRKSVFTNYSKKKIERLETGQEEFTFYIIDDLAAFFNITISEFLSKGWESYNTEEIENINFNIEEYFHGHSKGISKTFQNLSDIIPYFDLVRSNEWVSLPKYDFIMREYYDYLYRDISKESIDTIIYRAKNF